MSRPIEEFPRTREQPGWARLCAVHGRAYGYSHSDRVRRMVRHLVAVAMRGRRR